MKTLQPLILTARVADDNLEPCERLRQEHFPPPNFLHAHLTMFHRLPGEYAKRVVEIVEGVGDRHAPLQPRFPVSAIWAPASHSQSRARNFWPFMRS